MGKGATWGTYYSHGRSRFGERLCSGILCMLCIGPILTIIGLVFLVGSLTDTRTPAIHRYNDAVGRWVEGGGHATLVNGTTGTNVWYQFGTTATRQLAPVTREDVEIVDDTSSVRARRYGNNVLRYSVLASVDFTRECDWSRGCDTGERLINVFIGSLSSQFYTVRLPAIRAEYRRREDTANDCSAGDYWDWSNRQCVGYSILTTVCVKLANTSLNGTWRVDNAHGGEGCGEAAGWQPGIYERLRVYSQNDLPRTRTITFQMRSTDDPRVQFFVIRGAGAQLNFGLTQGEKFAIGAALLAVGGLITVGVLSCVCCVVKTVSGSNQASTYQSMPTQTATFVQPMYQQPVPTYPQQPYGQPQPYQPYGQPQQPVYMGQQPGYGR